MAECSSCGATIRWEKTIKGRPIPLDPEPVPNGNIVIGEEGTALVFNNAAGISPRLQDEPRYVSHFATCPDADKHRHV